MRRLLKGRRLLEGGAYFNVKNHSAARIRGQHLFEVRRLLEEKLYVIVELSLKKNKVVLSLKFTLPY